MAIRNIRTFDDEIFRKICRKVTTIDARILTILEDLGDTMRAKNAIGLACPHIGILRRIVVADIGQGLIEIINPIIVSQSGEQIGKESSVSLLSVIGDVKRPKNIIVEGLNRNGENLIINATGLLARVLCHEIDHLDGILFTDKIISLS